MFFGKESLENKLKKENISNFNSVIDAIGILIKLQVWDKAANSIIDIKTKEKEALADAIEKLPKYTDKFNKDYSHKEKKIKGLEKTLLIKRTTYETKIKKQRLEIQIKRIKGELSSLVKDLKYKEALGILTNFLEKNRGDAKVSAFYNSEKKKLKKKIIQQEKREAKKLATNTKIEAEKLLGKNLTKKSKSTSIEKESFLTKLGSSMKKKFDMRHKIKAKILLDEVTELIKAENEASIEIVQKKLTNIHAGLIKEINGININGYEVYGKMLGADKISGDTFGLEETKASYKFFLGDATGHGIRAGLIVSLLSKAFDKYAKKMPLIEMVFNINNDLKQDLQSRNFVTGIFFEVIKRDISKLRFIGMGHEPMLVFRRGGTEIEKHIPGGLAAGIRIIKEMSFLKLKTIDFAHGDMLISFTDGLIEAKNYEGEAYGMARLQERFSYICNLDDDIKKIYDFLIDDLKFFKGGSKFLDDVTILIIKRNANKDVISEEEIEDIQKNEKLSKSELQSIKGLANDEVEIELRKIKEKKELTNILKNLEALYLSGEILKLKQESIRFIKQGFIDKKINFYLKKALANEQKYKIKQKNQKLEMKYSVLTELFKKGDYSSVIKEIEDIISKDGNI